MDPLLARVERASRSHTFSDVRVARGATVCITCPVALAFEWRRIADWVAYHSLLGVDCFVLFLDESKVTGASRAALRLLLAAPKVKLFRCPHSDGADGVRMKPYALIRGLESMAPDVRPLAYLYIDVDEFVAYRADKPLLEVAPRLDASLWARATARFKRAFVGTSGGAPRRPAGSIDGVLAQRARHMRIADALYLHRWNYGTSGYDAPPPLSATPEFGLLLSRRGIDGCGKLLVRLGQGVRLVSMHLVRKNATVRLPDGARFRPTTHADVRAQNARLGGVYSERQQLSINHFNTGSRQECLYIGQTEPHTLTRHERSMLSVSQLRPSSQHSFSAQ